MLTPERAGEGSPEPNRETAWRSHASYRRSPGRHLVAGIEAAERQKPHPVEELGAIGIGTG